MAAVLLEIADAIVTALNSATTLSQSFVAERSYAEWGEELKDIDSLRVDVVPLQTGPDAELSDRGTVEYKCEIDIGVRKRFAVPEQETGTGLIYLHEMDALVLLVQEIAEFFMIDRLTDTNTAIWESTEIKLSWSRRYLREMRQFFGFVRLTFKVVKTF